MTEFLNIECEFGADMSVRALAVGHCVSILALELGKFKCRSRIDRLGMSDGVAQIMRERTDRERVLVNGVRVVEHPDNEISGPDVVCEVAEEGLAEGIVAHVLDDASAVSVGVGYDELVFCGTGELGQEQRSDRIIPRQIDEFLVGQDRVGIAVSRCEHETQDKEHLENGRLGHSYVPEGRRS